ncbi:MAG: TatD family hydrolase [Candidatus Zixiibacteriota bacterium]
MIDSHCHLDSSKFGGRDDELVREANQVGVHTIVNIGADLPSSRTSVELADRFPSVYAAVGIHPHDATTCSDSAISELEQLAATRKVVAVGEIGLDYYRDLSPRPVQKRAFQMQLELAVALHKPVVVHTREAFAETVEIIGHYAARLPGAVFHCFPGDIQDAQRVFDLGFVISVGGVITYKNSRMAKVAAEVPLDKIMLETDAPYLTPEPYRGEINKPAYVRLVCEKLAQLRGSSIAEVEKITDRTSQKLYRLVDLFGE